MMLSEKLYKILIQGGSWRTILGGLWVTIQISALALLLLLYTGVLDRARPHAGDATPTTAFIHNVAIVL